MPPRRFIFDTILDHITKASLSTEILYSFVIIVCSLMIYFGTKELYELSGHKGIKFFRKAFLYFALAYFFRSFIKLILFYFNVREIFSISPFLLNVIFGGITLIFFMYFSIMAVFYLLYSVIYKKWNHGNKIYFFHFIAIILSFFCVLLRNPLVYFGINLILLIFVIISVYISYKNSERKGKYNLYTIYVLLLFFWIINIIDILIPAFFKNFQILIYLTSSFLFFLMLYKVLKKVGSN